MQGSATDEVGSQLISSRARLLLAKAQVLICYVLEFRGSGWRFAMQEDFDSLDKNETEDTKGPR